ncbi:MAG: thioredoxin domain-containing protein [Desulfobulbaceae bacterium]|nr:thioredoxin domain-containing protein [Desulfobulbaceae bacterium]
MNDMIIKCPACGVKNRIPAARQHLRPKCGRCGHALGGVTGGKVMELDDGSFDRITGSSSLPVLVDFYSPTCGPCRMLAPVIDALARKFEGKAVVAKYDTSRYQAAASRFQIRGVPTLIFIKQGRVVDQVVGAAPQSDIEQRLNRLL